MAGATCIIWRWRLLLLFRTRPSTATILPRSSPPVPSSPASSSSDSYIAIFFSHSLVFIYTRFCFFFVRIRWLLNRTPLLVGIGIVSTRPADGPFFLLCSNYRCRSYSFYRQFCRSARRAFSSLAFCLCPSPACWRARRYSSLRSSLLFSSQLARPLSVLLLLIIGAATTEKQLKRNGNGAIEFVDSCRAAASGRPWTSADHRHLYQHLGQDCC